MKVLIDVHHSDLMESLHRLFEDRLGFEVHIPYGLEWKERGYWNFGWQYPDHGMGVAKQFLLTTEVDELQPARKRRLTTLEEALDYDDWAFVVATVPDNEPGYHRFATEKGARYCVQVGNVNQYVDLSLRPLILDATGQYPGGVPFTPEFDLEGAFAYDAPSHNWRMSSFVNLFNGLPCYGLFQEASEHLPSWVKMVYGHAAYGAEVNGGFLKPTTRLAQEIARSSFVWQDKVTGDGFGYVIHYAASVGRPIIGHASHYRNQTASDLWVDKVTCIDLDQHSPEETARLMQEIVNDRDWHSLMCQTIAERVRERIDFRADAERVSAALGMLVTA